MKKGLILITVMTLLVAYAGSVAAQQVAVKSNLLYDATGTVNLGVEIGLGRKLSLDLSGNLNAWNYNRQTGSKLKHIMVQPELRYWTCERFTGHFLGLHMHWANYNVGGLDLPFSLTQKTLDKYRYRGDLYGIGVGYGYQWGLGRRWALEAEIGVGYTYLQYNKYECRNCGKYVGKGKSHYFGPTKAALSLIFFIK